MLSIREQPAADKQNDNNFVGCVYILISYCISFICSYGQEEIEIPY